MNHMSLKEHIDLFNLLLKTIAFIFPLLLGAILFIKLRKKPPRMAFMLFLAFAMVVISCFVYGEIILRKVEAEIEKFVFHPYKEYFVSIDGEYLDTKSLIHSLRRISTSSTKTFSSRQNKRVVKISRGNEFPTLIVFDSSDREHFYWVVYKVPQTNFYYKGRIRINDVD